MEIEIKTFSLPGISLPPLTCFLPAAQTLNIRSLCCSLMQIWSVIPPKCVFHSPTHSPGSPGKLALKSHCSPFCLSQGSISEHDSPRCRAHTWQHLQPSGTRGTPAAHWGAEAGQRQGLLQSWHRTWQKNTKNGEEVREWNMQRMKTDRKLLQRKKNREIFRGCITVGANI